VPVTSWSRPPSSGAVAVVPCTSPSSCRPPRSLRSCGLPCRYSSGF
jgi:hypothetical protein